MKNSLVIICLLVPFLSCAQQIGNPMFSINNGIISTNSQFIDSYHDPEVANDPYGSGNTVGVQVGNVNYVIKTAIFTGFGWDNDPDPGYYIIEVSANNQIKFVHKQNSAFVTRDMEYQGFTLQQHADNDYFIKAPLSNEATALIFVGWSYANNPSQLFIVVLTETDVKVVYNKPMVINSITQSGYNFSMATQSNVLEWVNGAEQGTPITHTIYQQDGVLYFKDNLVISTK